MSETELIGVWDRARRDLVLSQLAPTALLGFSVWLLLQGLGDARLMTRFAAAGILLASGILGALVQYSVARQAQAVARELATAGSSAVASGIVSAARWLWVVKFVTPAIFVIIFAALAVSLFSR
jgi:hypothetical protein